MSPEVNSNHLDQSLEEAVDNILRSTCCAYNFWGRVEIFGCFGSFVAAPALFLLLCIAFEFPWWAAALCSILTFPCVWVLVALALWTGEARAIGCAADSFAKRFPDGSPEKAGARQLIGCRLKSYANLDGHGYMVDLLEKLADRCFLSQEEAGRFRKILDDAYEKWHEDYCRRGLELERKAAAEREAAAKSKACAQCGAKPTKKEAFKCTACGRIICWACVANAYVERCGQPPVPGDERTAVMFAIMALGKRGEAPCPLCREMAAKRRA